MRYVIARLQTERRDEAYRFYVTEGLRSITKTVFEGFKVGSFLQLSLDELLNPPKEDKRTYEEIVDQVWSNMGV